MLSSLLAVPEHISQPVYLEHSNNLSIVLSLASAKKVQKYRTVSTKKKVHRIYNTRQYLIKHIEKQHSLIEHLHMDTHVHSL